MGLRRFWLYWCLWDIVTLLVAFELGFAVRTGWPPPTANFASFLHVAPAILIILPVVFFSLGIYMQRQAGIASTIKTFLLADSVCFLITTAGAFWLRDFALPRSVLVIAYALHLMMALGPRLALRTRQPNKPARVVIAAEPQEAVEVVAKFLREGSERYSIQLVVDPAELCAECLATIGKVDIVALGPSVIGLVRQRILRLALTIGATAYVLPAFHDILIPRSAGVQVDDIPVFAVTPLGLSPIQRVCKRAFDLACVVPMLLVSSPIMAVVWAAIKVFSPGPALFTQTRVGADGQEFTVFKFRTMVINAEKTTGPVLATAKDPRVTPLGDFLRATRLDELPQLWNVLCGDMSLVGPRPERPFFVHQFEAELPDYPLRHIVRPGLTGLAQVMGKYGSSAQDKLRFDLYYIRHYSVLLDVKLMLLTVWAVVNKRGASELGSHGMDAESAAQEMLAHRSITSLSRPQGD